MELVTGSHAQPPGTHSQWVAGPACTPQGWAAGRGRVPNPGRPTPRQEAPPPGALVPPPQCAKAARKSARCAVGVGSPHPHPPHPQPVGSGPRPHARRTGGRVWESAQPGRPGPRQQPPPPGAPVQPPQRAKPACTSAHCGVGDRSPRPHPPHPQAVSSGRRLHAQRTGGRSLGSASTRTPHTQVRETPSAGAL